MNLRAPGGQYITSFALFLLLFGTLTYLATTPKSTEQFMSMYLLNSKGEAQSYFPNNDTTVSAGDPISWKVVIQNHVSLPQLAVLVVKLGNDSLSGPNTFDLQPASMPILAEFPQVLLPNQTWTVDLNWHIDSISISPRGDWLKLSLNGTDHSEEAVTTEGGLNYNIVMELWTLSPSSGSLIFGWSSSYGRGAAALEMWFNSTSP